ncbi:MAG: epimerase [Planctomycetota bacterium]|nr:MAG: epimerase [Planctomycetota bacterium]
MSAGHSERTPRLEANGAAAGAGAAGGQPAAAPGGTRAAAERGSEGAPGGDAGGAARGEPSREQRLAAAFVPPMPGVLEAAPRTGRRRLLITGISGGLGKVVFRQLRERKHDVDIVGLARSPLHDVFRGEVEMHVVDLTQNRAEDVFREGEFDTVVHLAFEDDPRRPAAERYKGNVIGTMRLLDWCARYAVRKVVVATSAMVYGAHPDNPTLIDEDMPTRADQNWSMLRDLVEADRYVVAWMWKYPEVETTLLRPVHVLGPTVASAFQFYLTRPLVPVIAGFDPMTQVVHEQDVARAVVLAVDSEAWGVFNIVGPGALPVQEILEQIGAEVAPLSTTAVRALFHALWRLKLVPLSPHLVDFLRYPLVVSGDKAEQQLGYRPRIPLADTLASVRWR